MLAKSNEESKTISIKQAAEKANVSIPTIYNWVKSRKIYATKQGKSWQISQDSLEFCLAGKPTQPVLADESFAQIASKVVAELRPVIEQAFAIQQTCQTKTTELDSRVTSLEKELAELKQSLAKQAPEKPSRQEEAMQQGKSQESQARQSNAEPVARVGEARRMEQQPDEETAEKWLKENLDKWLDQPCTYGKAMGRSWRDLAENKGAKISLKGIESQPRAYLHALENWHNCESVWAKMKAKVALEVISKDGQGRYSYTA